jgi:predicted MFS family arabinose efflux permease
MAGRLPLWLGHVMASGSAIDLKRAALLVGCGVAATATLPLIRLRLQTPGRTRAEYPHGNFILLFLAGFGLWNLATGAFNPFFNMYLAERIHSSPESIGNVFAAGQLSQVLALLLAPVVFRRLGQARGISAMMLATAICLLALSGASTTGAAAAAYTSYMAFQWMSEPGINALLMSRVKSEERGGASSLYFLVAFSAQAVAAAFEGASMTALGYGPVLMAAAILALLAGAMFRSLTPREHRARSAERTPSFPGSAAESAPR